MKATVQKNQTFENGNTRIVLITESGVKVKADWVEDSPKYVPGGTHTMLAGLKNGDLWFWEGQISRDAKNGDVFEISPK